MRRSAVSASFPRIESVAHPALLLQHKPVRGVGETVFRQGHTARGDISVKLEKVAAIADWTSC